MQFSAIPADNHPLLLHNLQKAQRSPAAYLNSTVGIAHGYGAGKGKARPYRQDLAVKQFQSWVYKAAMLNAKAFASTPLRLYMRKRRRSAKAFDYRTRPVPSRRKGYLLGDGRERPSNAVLSKIIDLGSDFEEVTEPHPALQVLSSANDWQNGYELSVLRALYWQITGNAYLHPVIGPLGVPNELWVMPSQWVRVIPDKQTFVRGYVYGRPPDEKTFATDEVIHWKLPNIEDPFYGKGWVEALWTALGLHNAKRVMDTAKFENMARPDYLVVVKNAAGGALDRMEEKINGMLSGAQNTGRFLSVAGEVSIEPLNFDVPEIGDPDKVIEEIAAVADVPLYKLRGNDPVKANSETQDVGWLRDTILPYCRMDEEQLNAKYLPLFDLGEDAVLAYDNPVPTNTQMEADILSKEVGGPVKTPNEGREELGLEPIDGGDDLRDPPNADPLAGVAGMFNVTQNADGQQVGPDGSPLPVVPQPTEQAPAVASNDLRTTVGGSAQVLVMQQAWYEGTVPRDAAIANAVLVFGFTQEQAEQLFPNIAPDAPKSADQLAQEAAQLEALKNPAPATAPAQEAKPVQSSDGKSLNRNDSVRPAVRLSSGVDDSEGLVAGGPGVVDRGGASVDEESAGGVGTSPGTNGGSRNPDGADADTQNLRRRHQAKSRPEGVARVETPPPQARPLPQGEYLIPVLRKTFAAQRSRVLQQLQGKSLEQVEDDYYTKSVSDDGKLALTESHGDHERLNLYAWRRAGAARAKATNDPSRLPPAFIPLDSFNESLAAEAAPVISRLMTDDARRVLTQLGAQPDVFHVVERNIPEAAQKLSLKFAESTNATTSMQLDEALSKLRDEISAGLTEGDTRVELTKRVEEVFDQADSSRAETIARTEGSRAAHEGELMGAKESGVVSGKYWMASADACDICLELAAKGTIPLDENFTETDYGPVSGPPCHPNDQCSLGYETKDSTETDDGTV